MDGSPRNPVVKLMRTRFGAFLIMMAAVFSDAWCDHQEQRERLDAVLDGLSDREDWERDEIRESLEEIALIAPDTEAAVTARLLLATSLLPSGSGTPKADLEKALRICREIAASQRDTWHGPMAAAYTAFLQGLLQMPELQKSAALHALQEYDFSLIEKSGNKDLQRLAKTFGTKLTDVKDGLNYTLAQRSFEEGDIKRASDFLSKVRNPKMGRLLRDKIESDGQSAGGRERDRKPDKDAGTTQLTSQEARRDAKPTSRGFEMPWPWIIGGSFFLAVIGGVLFKFLRR